jgi:hypothetical protein
MCQIRVSYPGDHDAGEIGWDVDEDPDEDVVISDEVGEGGGRRGKHGLLYHDVRHSTCALKEDKSLIEETLPKTYLYLY